MSVIGSAVSGVVKPFAEAGGKVFEEKQKTRRAIRELESGDYRASLEATQALAAGQSTWRPMWMHGVRRIVVAFYYLTLIILATVFAAIASLFFQIVDYTHWQLVKADVVWFWEVWGVVAAPLGTLATLSFLGYAPARSLEKISGKTLSGTIGGLKDMIPQRRQAVERTPVQTRDSIERIDGITAPQATPRNNHVFGAASERHLSECHDDIVRVHRRALTLLPPEVDMAIIDGARTVEEQRANINKGVSWTMKTRHLERPSKAVDHVPWVDGAQDVSPEAFKITTDAIKQASMLESVPCEHGIDWAGARRDAYHTEMHRDTYPYQQAPDIEI